MSGSKSTTSSEKVEASLDDAMANFILFKKEMGAEFRRKNAQLESEKQLLEAGKEELDAAMLELEADRAEFEAIRDSDCSPDLELESEKAVLKVEKMQLEAEKIQLKTAQAQLRKDRDVLESEKTQLRVGQSKLKAAQSQLDDAKTQLESAQSHLEGTRAQLEIAQAHLEAAVAEAVLNNRKLAAAKASLEVARRRFMAATKQLNAAKSRFESAKILLDAALAEESDRVGYDKAAELEIKVSELESEKSKRESLISLLEDDKLSLKDELSQSKAEVKSLSEKLSEAEKQLDRCCKDKSAMQDGEMEAGMQQEKVRELEKQVEIARQKWNENPRVFLDIAIYGRAIGRIVIKLDIKTTPKTCENFRALCTGEKGIGRMGKPLHYKGTKFYPTFSYCVGGDNLNHDGLHGESIYGTEFPKENFIKKHTGPGVVSMQSVNISQQCAGSQFFITTAKFENYDGVCVAFGDVVEGMNVVMEIMKSRSGTSVVADCGQLY